GRRRGRDRRSRSTRRRAGRRASWPFDPDRDETLSGGMCARASPYGTARGREARARVARTRAIDSASLADDRRPLLAPARGVGERAHALEHGGGERGRVGQEDRIGGVERGAIALGNIADQEDLAALALEASKV